MAAIVFAWSRSPMPVTTCLAHPDCARSAARPPAAAADGEPRQSRRWFHFARFEWPAWGKGLGIAVNPVLHKVARRLARTYSSRHGLKEVVQEALVVWSSTSSQSSDWGRSRKLARPQLAMPPRTCASCSLPVGASRRSGAGKERLELARRLLRLHPVFL